MNFLELSEIFSVLQESIWTLRNYFVLSVIFFGTLRNYLGLSESFCNPPEISKDSHDSL